MTSLDMWRSKDMTHLRLVIQREACHDVVRYVGKNTKVMFEDLCPDKTAFEREFAVEVQRCSEVEHKINFMRRQIEISGFNVPEQITLENPYLDNIAQQLDEFEGSIIELNKQQEQLKRTKRELKENEVLIEEVESLLDPTAARNNDVGELNVHSGTGIGSGDVETLNAEIVDNNGYGAADSSDDSQNNNLLGGNLYGYGAANDASMFGGMGALNLGFSIITGLINANNIEALTKIIFRIMKGNVIIRTSDAHITLKDPQSGKSMDKVAFLIFFSAHKMTDRLHQMCIGAGATLYDVRRSQTERVNQRRTITNELNEAKRMLKYNKEQRRTVILEISPYADAFSNYINEEKSIYNTMNMFKTSSSSGGGFLIAECWIPTAGFEDYKSAVSEADTRSAAAVPTSVTNITNERGHKKVKPPTYFPLNRFAKNFQGVSDAYGVPNYKEINPGFFYTFTFPFLFAIMFGDIAHGFINACVALLMVIMEKKLKSSKGGMNDIIEILFSGRYLIVVMCCMSVIVGTFYNEVFGLGWRTFGSAFYSRPYTNQNEFIKEPGQANIFGMDTLWMIADNAMTFTNSYKMKMAIILGIAHMTLGLILKLLNFIKFKDLPGFVFTWLPQIIFFGAIFFYMVFLIIYKWFHLYQTEDNNDEGINCDKYAPSLITTMINLFLGMGKVSSDEALYGFITDKDELNKIFEEEDGLETFKTRTTELQSSVQLAIVIIVVIAVIWLLFGKLVFVCIVKSRRKKQIQNGLFEPGESIVDDKSQTEKLGSNEVDISSSIHDGVDESSSGRGNFNTNMNSYAPNKDTTQKKPNSKAANMADEEEEDEYSMPFGELIVHQGISVIEFCIGCISHTASYLRLWALSLAHSQLAEVFFEIMVENAVTVEDSSGAVMGVVMGIFGTWAWLFFSLAVLCLMECLSAFLHTLRLHWVEYQDKFFGGEGVKFEPLKFRPCTPIENTTFVTQRDMNKEKETEKKLVDKELMKERKKRMKQ